MRTPIYLTADIRALESRHSHLPLMERAGEATARLARKLALQNEDEAAPEDENATGGNQPIRKGPGRFAMRNQLKPRPLQNDGMRKSRGPAGPKR